MKDVIEHKFKFHEDDRGQRFQDVYGDNMSESQINVTFINSTKHIVAWHKHNIQTDYWTVLKGLLKVSLNTYPIRIRECCRLNQEYITDIKL